jgi:hypothetical protein
MIASAARRTLLDRMLGAALLENDVYDEASYDDTLRTQATLAVAVTALSAGVGSLGAGLAGFIIGAFAAIIGWVLYAFATYWLATEKFAVPKTVKNLNATFRSLGLASSPRTFLFLTIVPEVGFLVGLFVHAWALIATVIAVRVALDLDLRSSILTAVGGWFPMLIVWALVALVF